MLNKFLLDLLEKEVIPIMNMEKEGLTAYLADVVDRFKNPYIKHYLRSISLNAISKIKVRLLPSILEYIEQNKVVPQRMTFAFSAMLRFYGQHFELLKEENHIVDFFRSQWQGMEHGDYGLDGLVHRLLGAKPYWGQDLNEVPGFSEVVKRQLHRIMEEGIPQSIQSGVHA